MKRFLIDSTITVQANNLADANTKADRLRRHLRLMPVVLDASMNMVEELAVDESGEPHDSRSVPSFGEAA